MSSLLPSQSSLVQQSDSMYLVQVLQELDKRKRFNKLPSYQPYDKQKEFHAAGAEYNERLLMAGNQLGKTVAGGYEWAVHLTGRYPDWWDGAEFTKPVIMWASGVTNESTRDNPQRILIGDPAQRDSWGSGWIPKECFVGEPNLAMGIKHAVDSLVVRWGGGGDIQAQHSSLYFKSYEKGREKWQGPTLDGVWFDEEPPEDIYSEGRTRTQNGQRSVFTLITFTPLKGMSEVVRKFLQ